MNKADIITARAYYYEFLAYVFFWSKDEEAFKKWQEQAKFLASEPLGQECDFLPILESDFKSFCAEQNALLFDLSYANVPLSASFYDEGRDSGAKRIAVIEILKRSKYRPNNMSENEDFIGFLFLLMMKFLQDQNEGDEGQKELAFECARDIFCNILNAFVDELCELLNSHNDSKIFKALSGIISDFMGIEREVYGIKAPQRKTKSIAKEAMARKPHVSKMPTAKSKLNWDEFTAL